MISDAEIYAAQIHERLKVVAPAVAAMCGFERDGMDERVQQASLILGSHIASASKELARHTVDEVSILWRLPDGLMPDDWWYTPLGKRAAIVGWYDDGLGRFTVTWAARLLEVNPPTIVAYVDRGHLERHSRGFVTRRSVIDRMGGRAVKRRKPKYPMAEWVAQQRRSGAA